MGGYLLLAVGLINWQYQNADEGIASRSLLIAIPGVVIVAIKDVAVAITSPLIPANHVENEIVTTATANVRNEFTNPTEVSAADSSFVASTSAKESTNAKAVRSKARESQIKATRLSPTTIEGRSLRPARALIASFIEWRSLTRGLLNSRLLEVRSPYA